MPVKEETEQLSPVISFRSAELAVRVQRLADMDRRTKGAMARILLEDSVAAEERLRGLPPCISSMRKQVG